MKIDKILIALDYDPSAEKVAETGYALAKAFDADTTLLHIIADPAYYSSIDYSPIMGFSGFSNPNIIEMVDTLKKESQHFLEHTKKHLGDESIKTLVLEGDFSDSILEAAKDLQADLIVMGTHNRRGLNKVLMGNLAEKVLHQTHIPIFVVPTKEGL
jgi:nucleotide-binding universal stress UspA family protein